MRNKKEYAEAKKIYVWGTGDDARTVLRQYPFLNVFVNSFIDSYKVGGTFYERPIITPSEVNWEEPMFIIIATRKYYDEITQELDAKGLICGKDYCGYRGACAMWEIEFLR